MARTLQSVSAIPTDCDVLTRPSPSPLPCSSGRRLALRTREHWSPYPEDPRAYGHGAEAAGEACLPSALGRPSPWGSRPGRHRRARTGRRRRAFPYGFELGISYPHTDPDHTAARDGGRDARLAGRGPEVRAAVCAEILHRINARSVELALAAAHTSGHNPVMAFHAGAVHAQDRGLEAVAWPWPSRPWLPCPGRWRKPQGDHAVDIGKTFTPVPLGISWSSPTACSRRGTATPACSPRWPPATRSSSSPIRPPSCRSRSPSGSPARRSPMPVSPPTWCASPWNGLGEAAARTLALRPEIRLIDYSGTTAFGTWLVEHAARPASSPPGPPSTPWSSTPPATTGTCSPTSPSPSPSTAASSAPARRTS